jgi:hypothetical protein
VANPPPYVVAVDQFCCFFLPLHCVTQSCHYILSALLRDQACDLI